MSPTADLGSGNLPLSHVVVERRQAAQRFDPRYPAACGLPIATPGRHSSSIENHMTLLNSPEKRHGGPG